MSKTIITGDEPYYPVVESGNPTESIHLGITIRQKFIADWMIQNESTWDRKNGNLYAAAENRFQLYLKLINEPQS